MSNKQKDNYTELLNKEKALNRSPTRGLGSGRSSKCLRSSWVSTGSSGRGRAEGQHPDVVNPAPDSIRKSEASQPFPYQQQNLATEVGALAVICILINNSP